MAAEAVKVGGDARDVARLRSYAQTLGFELEPWGAPEAVADALKKKLGCTTAVLKLPGNNVKDHEVLLQGHCVTEVTEYLRDCYCLGKEWLDMGQVDRELKKKQQSGEASRPNFR